MTPKKIKLLRLSLGLTQTNFSRMIGLSGDKSYISQLEHGTKKPSKVLANVMMLVGKFAEKSND